MSSATSIEWTDRTWNPVTGCDKVSPGCANCYAEAVAKRFWPTQYRPMLSDGSGLTIDVVSTSHHEDMLATGQARPRRFTDVISHENRLTEPLRWRKSARVFVNSMSDLFHEDVPDSFIDCVFGVMALAEQHTFQVLTKRADRMRRYLDGDVEDLLTRWADAALTIEPLGDGENATDEAASRYESVFSQDWPLPNVWLGVSVENQTFLERADKLKDTPAAVHFISFEPLLEQLGALILDGIEWAIVGGESGPGARPCALEWIESVVRECKRNDVPVFVKQLGAYVVSERRTCDPQMCRYPERALRAPNGEAWAWRAGLRSAKGGDPAEWPAELRVREFPRMESNRGR